MDASLQKRLAAGYLNEKLPEKKLLSRLQVRKITF
jgi:hypothetical protein